MTIAKYIRLSDQDDDRRAGEKPESNSVVNQRALLDRYLGGHPDLYGKTLEFVDDGHSGTNFHRPGVQALLARIQEGKIACVIVKDFSRFGRNYLEVGDYLERVFPFLGVRFIAVNDGYDSKQEFYGVAGDLTAGVRNLMNELYSRDLSQRVKTARVQYARRGACITAYPIYGYRKGQENRRSWEVDPPAAEGVQRIFTLALTGMSLAELAHDLTLRQIPTPSQRKAQLGICRKAWTYTDESRQWTRNMIRVILREERYTGKLISNRRVRYEVGNPSTKAVPREGWIVAEEAHPALVSEEIFQAAKSLFPKRSARGCSVPNATLFTKKLHCGCCGRALERVKTTRISYGCRTCRHTTDPRLYEDELEKAVLAGLWQQLGMRGLLPEQSEEKAVEQQYIERAKSKKQKALTAFLHGTLSRQEYEAISDKLHCRQWETNDTTNRGKRGQITTLTRPMMETLVDDILVHSEKRVVLIWQFRDTWKNLGGLHMERDAKEVWQQEKELDVQTIDPDTVADIDAVLVDWSLSPEEKRAQVFQQMKGNPYCYRCGDLLVKTSFRGTASLQELLEDCLNASELP